MRPPSRTPGGRSPGASPPSPLLRSARSPTSSLSLAPWTSPRGSIRSYLFGEQGLALERQLVQRPPRARLQRAVPAARLARGRAGARRPGRYRRRGAVRVARARALRPHARAGQRSSSGRRPSPRCGRGGSRSCSARPRARRCAGPPARPQVARRRARRSRAGWRARSRARSSGSAPSRTGCRTSERRGIAAAILAAAFVPALLIGLAFGTDGREPFDFSTFWPLPLMAIGFAIALPRQEKTLRIAALLYALACCAAYVIDSPMGGNAARFAGLLGAPVLICALLAHGRPRARAALATAAAALAGLTFIQWSPPVRDVDQGLRGPVRGRLLLRAAERVPDDAPDGPPGRVEIPFTRSHWEAYEVGRHHPLARGWLRQADIERNGIFYGGALDGLTYAAWLSEHGVRWVALPDAEARLQLLRRARPDRGRASRTCELRARLRALARLRGHRCPNAMVVPKPAPDIELERARQRRAWSCAPCGGRRGARYACGWSHYWSADSRLRGARRASGRASSPSAPARSACRCDFAPAPSGRAGAPMRLSGTPGEAPTRWPRRDSCLVLEQPLAAPGVARRPAAARAVRRRLLRLPHRARRCRRPDGGRLRERARHRRTPSARWACSSSPASRTGR